MTTAIEDREPAPFSAPPRAAREEPTFDLHDPDAGAVSESKRARQIRFRLSRLRARLPAACAVGLLVGTFLGAGRTDALLEVALSGLLGAVACAAVLAVATLVRRPR